MVLQTKKDQIVTMPRAMILAAGLGTRLRPLTETTPKALLNFRDKPMLEHVISKLKSAGITEIIINIHHHADQIEAFVERNNSFGLSISFSDERSELLDTGGGILKARSFFEGHGPFIVYNIDIFSSIDLQKLYLSHLNNYPLATLAVKQRETSRNFLANADGILSGWRNNQTGEKIITREGEELSSTAFSGIHVISDRIFSLLDTQGPFSITKAYLELSKMHNIHLHDHSKDEWTDMAHPENFKSRLI